MALVGPPVGKKGGDQGVGSLVGGCPGSHREKEFPCLECIWQRLYGLSGGKDPAGATELPSSAAQEQRRWLRAANLGSGFVL